VMFPVLDPELADRVLHEIIPIYLADNTRARVLDAEGTFHLLQPGPGETPHRCQHEFLALRPAAAGAEVREPSPPGS
jgi:polyphosphate kinase